MNAGLSPNTQAIVLLTSSLRVGRGGSDIRPLDSTEYGRLAVYLHERKLQPADLLSSDAERIIDDCPVLLDKERARRLLERGFQLGQAVEGWRSRAIWVITRADAAYPRRMKSRMGSAAPPVLYGCGNPDLLNTGGVAIVGSRNIGEDLVQYTESVGRLAGQANVTVVSGGARGVDKTAMLSAVTTGGCAVGVLADALERAALNREYRDALLAKRLALISPYDPASGFTVAQAMQRNKLVYSLADAALVVSADWKKGGTWAGAIEQLDQLRFVRVYIRSSGESQKGLEALAERGASRWPNPVDAEGLCAALHVDAQAAQTDRQARLPFAR
jgi:DNA processing protein